MKIRILSLVIVFLCFFPPSVSAAQEQASDEIFKAKVVEILENNKIVHDDGSVSIQQKMKLRGLDGNWNDQEIIFDGTQFDVLSASEYGVGDKVLVSHSLRPDGQSDFYIVGFSRSPALYWLGVLFAFVVLVVGRLKGARSLVVLFLTFFIILKFIIPKILAGASPLFISIVGSFLILILAIYITEGFKKTSTVAIFSILISLILTGLLSTYFSTLTRLTGFASEEAMYLVGLQGGFINVKGLLLAGIIIGALGVLDDVAISQVMLVKELKLSNPDSSNYQIYVQAMRVGISHLSSMVNTLFLAYAGVSLPLLILFSLKQPPFLTFGQIIDNEMVATEIVRALVGSIGLILAVPITTFLASYFIKHQKSSSN
ncbi:MAG: YibE/F family protein [Candidatus Buchananbacteria bacterium]|nr:YibE/F family protein [Candidatus Buchananbacteria bacterium]